MSTITKRPTLFALLAGSLLAVLAVSVFAQAATPGRYKLVWDDPNPVGSVLKYRVFNVTMTTNTTTTPVTVTTNYALLAEPTVKEWPIVLPPGLHNVAVTVVGKSSLESEPSTNATVQLLIAVINLRVQQ